ncbi:capsule biosynthesis protein [Enterovirga aerilata]|uniref:Capsule biosynthesis protein n=1 Tax=Enterovirga aerilata TaxID=2730920 RepID=A0A849IEM5_9HYPH|nr:capsule biosynthesis protein [Enterovirga sp. DB1703]NNM74540.1 capsule biosynthesis protein [Enterovirga sp. DB1703]
MSEQIPAGRRAAASTVLDGTVQTVGPLSPKQHFRPLTRFYQRALSRASGGRLARQAVPVDVFDPEPATSNFPWGKLSFVACVLIPALAVSLYFAFIASDQFVAEARFVVRLGPQDGSAKEGLASVLSAVKGGGSGSGGTSATEDAHVVTSYIQSRAIVDDIQKTVDLRTIFTRPEADFYARLKANASIEELVEYWRGMVSTYIDSMSGIVTVEVRAFRPDDAVLLVRTIGELSEKLVNDISRRARQDALRRATEEVQRAQTLMYEAIRDTERYRNAEGLIDPIQTATETGKLLTKVLADQITAEGELFVASRSLAPDSPAVRRLTSRIEALRQQAADLRTQLAGNREEARNVAASLARFEEVAIKQKMAETLYALAEAGLDRARRQAEAQSVYLSVFVPPGLPQEYTYPKRFEYSIAIATALFVLWSIAALIWLSVEDHRLG